MASFTEFPVLVSESFNAAHLFADLLTALSFSSMRFVDVICKVQFKFISLL